LSRSEIEEAYTKPENERDNAIMKRGDNPGFIVWPKHFSEARCRKMLNDAMDCTFSVQWRRGGWHPKQGRLVKRADGTWVADEESQQALSRQ
jgi:hypothetical protein